MMITDEWLLWAAVMALMLFALGFICGWIAHRRKVDRWNKEHLINLPYYMTRRWPG